MCVVDEGVVKLDEVFEKLKEMNLIKFENDGKNKGCWVIFGEGKEEDKVIVCSNGIVNTKNHYLNI